MAVLILLWAVDGFPIMQTLFALVSHVVYLGSLQRFPNVKITDPTFLGSCFLVIVNHWLWMGVFHEFQQAAYSRVSSYYERPDVPSFVQVVAFFALCVWIVPFSIFISLSAGDNVLPTMSSEDPSNSMARPSKRQGMIKAVLDSTTDWIGKIWTIAGGSKARDRNSML
jgi:hypothetical protein